MCHQRGGRSRPPFTAKTTEYATTKSGLPYGVTEMQGWRNEMEDAHIVDGKMPSLPDHSLFAVFDGHGGDYSARFTQANLIKAVSEQEEWREYVKTKDIPMLCAALRKGFFDNDRALYKCVPEGDISGCTAVVTMITPTHLVCANAGDSRCVMSTKRNVKALSEDHKPDADEEMKRIVQAGGKVRGGRVEGTLAVSRAFGDFEFKVVCKPIAHPQYLLSRHLTLRAQSSTLSHLMQHTCASPQCSCHP